MLQNLGRIELFTLTDFIFFVNHVGFLSLGGGFKCASLVCVTLQVILKKIK